MAKLAILAALFAALIAVASATTYTMVVTTTVDEENPRQESCQTEIKEKSMSHCRSWMMEGRGRQGSFLLSAVANPRYEEEHLQECCDQMKMMSSVCVCDAIKKMMMDMQSKYGTQEMQQMMEKAEMLPQMCEMESPTKCRIRAVFF